MRTENTDRKLEDLIQTLNKKHKDKYSFKFSCEKISITRANQNESVNFALAMTYEMLEEIDVHQLVSNIEVQSNIYTDEKQSFNLMADIHYDIPLLDGFNHKPHYTIRNTPVDVLISEKKRVELVALCNELKPKLIDAINKAKNGLDEPRFSIKPDLLLSLNETKSFLMTYDYMKDSCGLNFYDPNMVKTGATSNIAFSNDDIEVRSIDNDLIYGNSDVLKIIDKAKNSFAIFDEYTLLDNLSCIKISVIKANDFQLAANRALMSSDNDNNEMTV